MTQSEALTIMKSGANVFLTGEPGSGKTHTVNAYTAWLRERGIEPSVTAATGIAATHVGGKTIHAWSGIGKKEYLSHADLDDIANREAVARRIHKATVLIIDEISMLSATTFGMADRVCREVRRTDAPFGGMQVILVGDFFQLPPVTRAGREPNFAYESDTWKELNPLICYLHEQHRQDDDAYLSVLSAIRRGEVEEYHFELLSGRRTSEADAPADAPRLYSHNADVDALNAAALRRLPGGAKRYTMSTAGQSALVEGLKRGCLSPELLEVKQGAAVMFTKNDPRGRFVNGTLGTVIGYEPGTNLPIVETRDGAEIVAEPMEWQVEENGKVRASVKQVPLRLAWAITVHKSQGLSMDAAVMDLGRAFEYGQGYVALSRVRRLAGLHLIGMNDRALMVHPMVTSKDEVFRELSSAAAATFAGMEESEIARLSERFVKAMGGNAKPLSGRGTASSGARSGTKNRRGRAR